MNCEPTIHIFRILFLSGKQYHSTSQGQGYHIISHVLEVDQGLSRSSQAHEAYNLVKGSSSWQQKHQGAQGTRVLVPRLELELPCKAAVSNFKVEIRLELPIDLGLASWHLVKLRH